MKGARKRPRTSGKQKVPYGQQPGNLKHDDTYVELEKLEAVAGPPSQVWGTSCMVAPQLENTVNGRDGHKIIVKKIIVGVTLKTLTNFSALHDKCLPYRILVVQDRHNNGNNSIVVDQVCQWADDSDIKWRHGRLRNMNWTSRYTVLVDELWSPLQSEIVDAYDGAAVQAYHHYQQLEGEWRKILNVTIPMTFEPGTGATQPVDNGIYVILCSDHDSSFKSEFGVHVRCRFFDVQ